MIILMLIILSCAVLGGGAGCSTVPAAPAAEKTAETPILGNRMAAAMQKQDYASFVQDFSKELQESVTPDAFRKLCSDLADRQETIDSWKLLDTLNRGGLYHTEVWKITFRRTDRRGQKRLDRLFYVTAAKLDGRTVVIGFRSDPLF